jgi:hypothetical protein
MDAAKLRFLTALLKRPKDARARVVVAFDACLYAIVRTFPQQTIQLAAIAAAVLVNLVFLYRSNGTTTAKDE